MVEKAMNPKKRFINEEDTCTLLQRYSAATVLALLNEVARAAEAKIDWEQLVGKTSTGISNAREYQMLWRHLAYGEALPAKFDDEAQPMDDDSDLEYELEAFPAAIGVASTEAAAGVKVLIAFGSPNESTPGKGATVDAPLTINVPKGPSSKGNKNSKPIQSMQRKKILVQKQIPLLETTASVEIAEGDDASGLASESMVSRKRKQRCSKADDSEFIAAVKKRGENWITLSEEVLTGDRSPDQLGQRWAAFKKQNPDLNVKDNSIGKLSEAQLAARHSLSIALGTAGTHPFKKVAGTNAQSKVAGTNAAGNPLLNTATEAESRSQKGFKPTEPYQKGLLDSTTKSRVASKNSITKLNANNDHTVRAIAVAAGARIASPSDAASLFKAAQSKNAVHIMPTGGSSVPSSLYGEARPNLHHMRTGMAAMPRSTPPTTPVIPSATQPGPFQSKQINGVRSSPGAAFPLKQEAKTTEGSVISKLGCTPTKQAQEAEAQEVKVDSPKGELKSLSTTGENVVGSLNIRGDDTGNKSIVSVEAEERQCAKDNQIISSLLDIAGGNPSAVQSCENQSTSVKKADFQSIVTDEEKKVCM